MATVDPQKKYSISYHQFLNMFEDRETSVCIEIYTINLAIYNIVNLLEKLL